MANEIGQAAILIEANVCVKSLDEVQWKNFEGFKKGLRPSIFANSLNHASVVIDCPKTIPPGTSGRATLLTASNALLDTNIAVGTEVQLRSGTRHVASARILSMKNVLVIDDNSNDEGYSIIDLPDNN